MLRWLKYLGITLLTLVLTFAQLFYFHVPKAVSSEPALRDKIALYAKPSVVRVLGGCQASFRYTEKDAAGKPIYINDYSFAYGSPGTGFFINSDGYIATYAVKNEEDCKERLYQNLARQLDKEDHILDPKDINFVKQNSELRGFTYYNNVVLPAPGTTSSDTLRKFQVKAAGGSLEEGEKDVAIIKIDIDDAPALKLGDSSKVKLDDVVVIGYPVIDATANSYEKVLSDDSVYESSVSEGKVSNANKRLQSNAPVLEINMLSVYGSAGSPVLNDQGEVIGIIAPTEADRNPFVGTGEDSRRVRDNGIPLAIPAKIIQEFIQDSGTNNRQGEIDQYYRSGLDLFWKEDYEGAKEKFEVVRDQFPQHSEIERLISECNKNKIDTFGKINYVLWGAIAAVVALVLGLIFFLMRRQPSAAPRSSADIRPFARHSPTGVPKSNSSQAYLEVEGSGETRTVPLYKDTHRIGRDPGWSDIEVPSSWEVLSRHHALLKREGNSYRIYDGDGRVPSRNGLLIDGYDKVDSTTGYLLVPGDILTIGNNPAEQVRITYYNAAVSQVGKETKVSS